MAYLADSPTSGVTVITVAGGTGARGSQGPAGPAGPPGPAGPASTVPGPPGDGSLITRVAYEAIPAGRFVVDYLSGRCVVANPLDITQAGQVLGYVEIDTPIGSIASIRQYGDVLNATYNFGSAGQLYMADDASLSRFPRTTGFSQIAGWTPDGVTATIRLGQARPIMSLGGDVIVPPSFSALMGLLYATSPADPSGLGSGVFYQNGSLLERTPQSPDTSIPTIAVLQSLQVLWGNLPSSPGGLGPAAPYINGRALSFTAPPANASSTLITPAFRASFGALWDAFPKSPVGLKPGDFYINGRSLERLPLA